MPRVRLSVLDCVFLVISYLSNCPSVTVLSRDHLVVLVCPSFQFSNRKHWKIQFSYFIQKRLDLHLHFYEYIDSIHENKANDSKLHRIFRCVSCVGLSDNFHQNAEQHDKILSMVDPIVASHPILGIDSHTSLLV